MKYVNNYDPRSSFWEVFPEFYAAGFFKDVYKKDQSKNKNKSSKLMWMLVLGYDLDSQFYKMNEDDKYDLLSDDLEFDAKKYCGGQEDWEITVNAFKDFIDTPLGRSVRNLEDKLMQRTDFINVTPYTLDKMRYPDKTKGESFKPFLEKGTAAQLDKMITDSGKLHAEVKALRAQLFTEGEATSKGGSELSATDLGTI